MAITGTDATGVQNEEVIDPRCIVKFRPGDDWVGQYGFDWFREGDYGEKVLMGTPKFSHYNDISNNDFLVGKYVTVIDGVCHQFVSGKTQDPDNPNATNRQFVNVLRRGNYPFVLYKDFLKNNYSTAILKGHETGDRYLFGNSYIVPTISLFYETKSKRAESEWGETSATIKIIINGENIDTDKDKITLKFECSNGIELSEKEIEGNSINKNNTNAYEHLIKISLKEDFSDYSLKEGEGVIKVYAISSIENGTINKTLAGKLNVEKCIPKRVDIVFVPIIAQLNSQRRPSAFKDIGVHAGYLKRFLGQAHIIPNIYMFSISTFNDETLDKIKNIISNHTQEVKNQNGQPTGELALDVYYKYVNNRVVPEDMGKELEKLFNQETSWLKYRNAYKVFLFGEKGRIEYKEVNNQVYRSTNLGKGNGIPSKAAVVFSLVGEKNTTSIICHELLHCFGFYHSFSNRSPYTLKKAETSNIMDYPVSPFELQTLWKWQWDKIRSAKGVKPMEKSILEKILPKIDMLKVKIRT